jgi:hypothetical protein
MLKPLRFLSWLLFPVCLVPTVSAQSPAFEGVVVYRMAMGGDTGQMTQMYKGTKNRTEIAMRGQAVAMIMDMANGTMTTLIPQQKMYMVTDLRKLTDALTGLVPKDDQKNTASPKQPPKIQPTGRTETVAGHVCEWYVLGENDDAEVCAAKGLGMFMLGQAPMGRAGAMAPLASLGITPENLKMFKDGFFPLKVVQNQRGQKQVLLEATSVEKKSLDASLFAPPSDYSEMKMPGPAR